MTEQLWAVVSDGGEFTLHYDDPEQFLEPSEVEGKNIWILDRGVDVVIGEKVDFTTGQIVKDLSKVAGLKLAEVSHQMALAFERGFAPSHISFIDERLQVRDMEDRTNWLTSQSAYSAAVAAGYGAVSGATFRTMSNNTFTVSYTDGLQTLLEMAEWGKTIMTTSWTLKDAINSAATLVELAAIDVEAAWPE